MGKENSEQGFQIGAVAKMTGVPSTTLRMWERRYQLVEPYRTESGKRLYRRADIDRLSLIRRLVDGGHAISTVARLSQAELLERLALDNQTRADDSGDGMLAEGCKLLVMGAMLAASLEELSLAEGIEIVGTSTTVPELERQASELKPDVLLLEYPAVHEETAQEVLATMRRLRIKRVAVVYEFANREAVKALHRHDIVSVRTPVTGADIRGLCAPVIGSAERTAISESAVLPVRRYDDQALSTIARVSTSIQCECPHHLVDLLHALNAFEVYSAECESRNAADSALHAHLHEVTAGARAMMEQALGRVIEAESIEI